MVSKENDRALHQIMAHINHAGCYAEWLQNVQHPMYWAVLWLTTSGNIGWRCYGQSACKRNLRELNWTIRHIFKMTPSEFLRTYEER